MISVCIPVYNYDISILVRDIHDQASKTGVNFEIVLIDDDSRIFYKEKNRELARLEGVVYEELEKNVGRSRIRNLLAAKARFPYLIFMDCDSQCPDQHYVKRYLDAAHGDMVVCGGRSYLSESPEDDTYLHWLYGTHREVRSCKERMKRPNHHFMTNNFMISSSLFAGFAFNENLQGYGHEDTLLGYELLQNNIEIQHIENPLIHVGLDSAEAFLKKTAQGTKNLLIISEFPGCRGNLAEMIKLLRTYLCIRKWGLAGIIATLFSVSKKKLEKNLTGRSPKLIYLDLYKLGSICQNASRG